MWWLLLPLLLAINHFSMKLVSQSHAFNYFIFEGLLFISSFQSSKIFLEILSHSLLQRKIDYSCLISTISTFIQDGYPRSSAAQCSSALWRVTASGLRRRSCSWPLQRLYHHICQCVNVSMCTQIRCQYHLTIQVKIGCPTD